MSGENTKDFDFKEIGEEAAAAEPGWTGNAPPIIDEKVEETQTEVKEEVKFRVEATFFLPAIMAVLNELWRSMWGASPGAELTEEEKGGMMSLFERGADHFGLVKHISGTKGFLIEFAGRFIIAFAARLANRDAREYFNENVLKKSKETQTETKKEEVKDVTRARESTASGESERDNPGAAFGYS